MVDRETRRQQELARGAEVAARHFAEQSQEIAHAAIQREFDPNYNEANVPIGYATWKEFRERVQLKHLPYNRDGSEKT